MTTKKTTKKTAKNLEYVIVRCRDAGVHAGYLAVNTDKKVVLLSARRIWYWNGAASLSEIAVHGINPSKTGSKIAVAVPNVQLRGSDVCEIIACLPAGKQCIEGYAEWRA